ncbi:hypothetical protein MC378_14765 [Polaribacter sp. MSW13]|uniref:Uncharacterized protein n=1 Tax=Polaribacter marinus TaxID=2916838 RepID=A0A9X1VPL8_9FLAO|nr:hypothetical protein [Polaribacter marinus]MCI2230439.1 hypothetical protein [Polaribacter marinus]
MNYIITVRKTSERHDNVVLEYRTEVEQKIEWQGQKYLVKEIIIVDPDENVIELKCWNVTNSGKPKLLSTISRDRI